MRTSKIHLPVLVENSIAKVGLLRTHLMSEFNQKVLLDKRVLGGTVTCRAGCSWCCYHPVSISIFEGIILYRWLVSQGKWSLKLKEGLQESAERQFGVEPEVWARAMISCPLLGPDDKCTAYQARPLICRAYYVVSDPYYCHPHRISKSHTSLVPRDSVVNSFHSEQESLLRKHKLQVITLPIGASLLMSEKICTGQIDLDALDGTIMKEYGDKV